VRVVDFWRGSFSKSINSRTGLRRAHKLSKMRRERRIIDGMGCM
jgi:hypothetical protein